MLHVIPAPQQLVATGGEPLRLGAATRVVVEPGSELAPVAVFAADVLGALAGRRVAVEHHRGGTGALELVLAADDGPADDEGYSLVVTADGARAQARTPAGLLRALATLRQLADDDGTIPAVRVIDAPRYGWRGLSLDVARHFVAVDDLEQILELMWLYKLQTLHLHLTDDQAWRIHLPSRPELARRSSSASVGGDPGGSYDEADWRRLLTHAAARGVSIVPEIDVPGHVNAALHADGSLTPSGEAAPEYLGIEVGFSRLHDDLPATAPFLRDVFGDLAAMTPGEYVHVGGDEVLTMERAEYRSLVGQSAAAVLAAGKKVVGWQETAHADLGPGGIVQVWDTREDPAPVVAAAQRGAGVLMSPGGRAYLDMKYEAGFPLGLEWAGFVEVRDAYDWDPAAVLDGLDPSSVVGVEAAVWTETLRTLDDLMLMLLPRLAAVAEVAWSSSARDVDAFTARLAHHPRFWDRAGWRWHPSPQVRWASHPAG